MKSITTLGAWRTILKYYREHDVQIVLEKMAKNAGEAYLGEDFIKLDPRDSIISVLIHELLHLAYPDATEEWVGRYETKIRNKITERQFKFLINILHERTYYSK